jgi:hypothetical protein
MLALINRSVSVHPMLWLWLRVPPLRSHSKVLKIIRLSVIVPTHCRNFVFGRILASPDTDCVAKSFWRLSQMSCQACGAIAPTKHVVFHQNIGALFVRFHKRCESNMCNSCIRKYFWEYTLITLFFGWWGVISFFVTPFFVVSNVVRYLGSLRPSQVAPAIPGSAVEAKVLQQVPIERP